MNQYYYIDSAGQQVGPVPGESLAGVIKPDTMVWCAGMQNWQQASTVAELSHLFSTFTPPQSSYSQTSYSQTPNYYGGAQSYESYEQRPYNFLVPAILSTVLCCPPFGIPAIVFAAQVNSKWESGDHDGARHCASRAKLWFILSAATGAFVSFIYFIMLMAAGL